jgi:dTDP-4-amino-4,6-dideoxygalactose transaminase
MDGIQAAVLSVKLTHLEEWNRARRERAARYRDLLAPVDEVELTQELPATLPVYHLFAVRVPRRHELQRALEYDGVHCSIHYPVPVHRQAAVAGLGLGRGGLEVCERAGERLLSLPIYPELTEEQQDFVVEGIRRFYG